MASPTPSLSLVEFRRQLTEVVYENTLSEKRGVLGSALPVAYRAKFKRDFVTEFGGRRYKLKELLQECEDIVVDTRSSQPMYLSRRRLAELEQEHLTYRMEMDAITSSRHPIDAGGVAPAAAAARAASSEPSLMSS